MPRKDVATQAGKVLTPILVLPWHDTRQCSAAWQISLKCGATCLCNVVLSSVQCGAQFCAMWCSVLCNAVLRVCRPVECRGKCLRGSSGGQLISADLALEWLATTGYSPPGQYGSAGLNSSPRNS